MGMASIVLMKREIYVEALESLNTVNLKEEDAI